MLQITLGLDSLSIEQREAVAAFIRTFPTAKDEPLSEEEQPAKIPTFTVYQEPDDDPAPEAVFSTNIVQMPASSVVPAPPAPAGVTLDKHGLPWDERIHTGSRATNADGTWRRKRGIDDATVTKVESELRALMAIPAANVPADEAPLAVISPASTVPAPPPAPPPPPAGPVTFIDLMTRASDLITAKQITVEQINAIVTSAGLPSLSSLQSRPDLVPSVLNSVNALVAA